MYCRPADEILLIAWQVKLLNITSSRRNAETPFKYKGELKEKNIGAYLVWTDRLYIEYGRQSRHLDSLEIQATVFESSP